jgi:diketogulonate reductase-like aldo/keto reductase
LWALDAAYDAGVTWFDVAPSYGWGQAEELLGRFLRGRRESVVVCTKISRGASKTPRPPNFLAPAARLAAATFPSLRKLAPHKLGQQKSCRAALRAKDIEVSITASLRRLRTDYIDVIALHDPDEAECTDPEILDALQGAVSKGLVREVSIAGSRAAVRAGRTASAIYEFAQVNNDMASPFPAEIRVDASARPFPFVLTYGVFKHARDRKLRELFDASNPANKGFEKRLLNFSLAKNADGIVLVSMYSRAHIASNCEIAGGEPDMDDAARLAALVSAYR